MKWLYRHNSAAVISDGEATVATALPPSVIKMSPVTVENRLLLAVIISLLLAVLSIIHFDCPHTENRFS